MLHRCFIAIVLYRALASSKYLILVHMMKHKLAADTTDTTHGGCGCLPVPTNIIEFSVYAPVVVRQRPLNGHKGHVHPLASEQQLVRHARHDGREDPHEVVALGQSVGLHSLAGVGLVTWITLAVVNLCFYCKTMVTVRLVERVSRLELGDIAPVCPSHSANPYQRVDVRKEVHRRRELALAGQRVPRSNLEELPLGVLVHRSRNVQTLALEPFPPRCSGTSCICNCI
jgi:hypothetical protein